MSGTNSGILPLDSDIDMTERGIRKANQTSKEGIHHPNSRLLRQVINGR